jgi:1-acyl-sn-glycerol-3-phosphate acyltransferase
MVYAARYLLIALYTVLWGTLAVPLFLIDRTRAPTWVARNWIAWVLATCGVRVEADGFENLNASQPCVIMSNHQSVFDIAAIVHTVPIPWRFVAKRELLRIPFFGWALALADQVVVDRGDREQAVASLKRAAERIRGGVSVIIFPEGTRSHDARLKPVEKFKSGGFHLAIEARVPIVPATVSGSHHIAPKKSLKIHSGVIKVHYGRPIPTADLSIDDRNELKRRVREALLAGYDPAFQL